MDVQKIGLGISVVGTIGSLFMGNQLGGINEARESYSQKRNQITALESSEELRIKQEKIANSRYTACELLAKGSYEDGFIFPSIDSQTTVINRHTNKALPKGTVVCDGNGNTAILDNDGTPDSKSIAFTGNRDIVAKRIARFRGGVYSQPIAK